MSAVDAITTLVEKRAVLAKQIESIDLELEQARIALGVVFPSPREHRQSATISRVSLRKPRHSDDFKMKTIRALLVDAPKAMTTIDIEVETQFSALGSVLPRMTELMRQRFNGRFYYGTRKAQFDSLGDTTELEDERGSAIATTNSGTDITVGSEKTSPESSVSPMATDGKADSTPAMSASLTTLETV